MKKFGKRILCVLLAAVLGLSLAPAAFAASAYDQKNQKLAALTFDDGPGPYSDWIMDTLESRGAKATFFMNGYLIQKYPDAVRRMAADGFQIGNHTYNHPFLAKSSDTKVVNEITSVSALLTQVTGLKGTGETDFYLRPPYGSYNSHVVSLAGVPVIWCTVDSGDWKYDSASRLLSYTSSVIQDGDIVIMHESHRSTAEGLGALVDKLQSMGYQLVTVEDLFWRRGVTPQAGHLYLSAPNTGVNRCARELYYDESKLSQHWAYPAIQFTEEKGLMGTNEAGEFTPNFPLTRAMFATALGRLENVTSDPVVSSGFSDLPASSYAAPYAAWAKKAGIMSDVADGKFAPNQAMNRQELATALARYAAWKGAEISTSSQPSYSDCGSIADWAKEGVAYCSANGLLDGENGVFRPLDAATRVMGATVLQRLSQLTFPPSASPTEPPVYPSDVQGSQSKDPASLLSLLTKPSSFLSRLLDLTHSMGLLSFLTEL